MRKTNAQKKEKPCFELFISGNMLKTFVQVTNKTMKKARNKSELTTAIAQWTQTPTKLDA